jgi:predicted small lipoprotein YifL
MHCWTRYVFIIVVAALGVLSMIEACGRKGPLYLPDPDRPQTSQPASKPAADSEVPKPPAAPAPVVPKWP